MTANNERHPVKNFFIKRSLQLSLVGKVFFIITLSAILTTLAITAIYNGLAQKGSFYYMSNDIRQDIQLSGIVGIILPAVIVAQIISLAIGLGVGLFSSRKIAVPLYKFERWVAQLKNGNLTTQIAFREKGEQKELTVMCNAMADLYRSSIRDIREAIEIIDQETVPQGSIKVQINKIKNVVGKFEV